MSNWVLLGVADAPGVVSRGLRASVRGRAGARLRVRVRSQ